jgi:hypothetical protein
MENKVIIYCHDNKHIAICTPCLNCGLSIEQIAVKDIPKNCSYKICNSNCIPKDATFFNAWIYDNKLEIPITIDVNEAHNIWKNEWRRMREPLLKKLDVEWMRALENGDVALTQELTNKKQILRDITLIELPQRKNNETIDVFTEKIKNIIPECLNC